MAPSGRVTSPTLAGGEELSQAYSSLEPHVQDTIKGMDLVRGGHLSPESAYNVLLMSKKKGQQFSDVLARHALGAPPPMSAAARNAATVAPSSGPRISQSNTMATVPPPSRQQMGGAPTVPPPNRQQMMTGT